MNKPEYSVTFVEGTIIVDIDDKDLGTADLIISKLISLGADKRSFMKYPYRETDILALIIFQERFNVSIQDIRDILTEHDDKIIKLKQHITVEKINTLLPEISSVTKDLSERESIKINMDSDKFKIGCYVYDGNMLDGLGLDIEKVTMREGAKHYIRITFDSIHDLRKLKLLGIVDCIMNDDCARIELPGFVFKSYPLI